MKKNNILVSIIVPTYNHEKYIVQTIDSLLNQKTDFEYEILVGDDLSTDHTRDILEIAYKNNSKVHLFLRERNVGACRNGYDLVMHARGKYIYIYEGDDYLTDDGALQYMADWMENHEGYAGIACRRIAVSERTGQKLIRKPANMCNCDISLNDFINRNIGFDPCATLYLNFYHDKRWDYRWYRMSRHVGDITIAIYILKHGKVYQSDRIVGVYRTDRFNDASCYNNIISIKDKYMDYIHILNYLERNTFPGMKLDYLKSDYAYSFIRTLKHKDKWIETILMLKKVGLRAWILMEERLIHDIIETFYSNEGNHMRRKKV